ncbi:Splicing factor [Xylographa soralifera]|nr:Splicing factor [Xylographa soralifera]
MDISALLSPQDSPVRDAPTPAVARASPRRARKSRTTAKSSTASKIGASPLSRAYVPAEPSPSNGALPARLPMPSPPMNGSPHQHASGTTNTPPLDGLRPHRQSSTSGMDTLADLASMQHHQQTARANAGGLRNTEVYDNPLSTAANLPSFHALTRKPSSSRSPFDLTMQDAHSQTPPPRIYSAPSLSQSESETIAQLFGYLSENPYAYESHVQLVSLLHRGLVNHVYPSNKDSATPYGDPHTYTLLPDLQTATEAMDARFALGEDLWAERMQAQKWLAVTLEDCLGVMETGQKAVSEETGSTKLWLLYGDWMLLLYNMAHRSNKYFVPMDVATDKSSSWSEEDKLVAAEAFGKKQILDIWHQAAEDTKFRINDSHLIWDRYMDLLLQDLSQSKSREAVPSIKEQFVARLQTPHATWDQTFQTFSTFISTYDNALYEVTMVAVNRESANARQKYEAREIFEIKLQRAIDNLDKSTEWTATTEYLDWERSQSRRNKVSSFEPANSLYQRAILRFSTDTSLWEDYSMFLVDESEHQHHSIAMLPLLERACRHCPWSGTLWSMYLQEAECEHRPFTDIGEIKHKATSTGLLDAGGMEEVLKVLTAWCGFLRRRAFQQDSTDEELDVAEVGIRSAIEDMETLGRQKYGNDYKGDPQYRLERIYIKYLSQSHNWQAARDTWKSLISRHGDSYEFWLRYYNWEMLTWGKHSPVDNRVPDEVPHEATKVLRQAVRRQHLDWPEKVMDTFLHHCEDHESVVELQLAVNQTRKAMKSVTKRREAEALEAAELAKQQQQSMLSAEYATQNTLPNGKRKRDGAETDENSAKKSRADIIETQEITMEEQNISTQPALKRDRENSTVIVKNLPFETTEKRVRHYFRDCGTINSLKIISDDGGNSSTATIEFDSKEDVLTAQTKDMKLFEGKEIEVQVGTGSTLYVTNFPPIADESYIRDLFGKYGDIVSVRFPSLKYDKRRRFCYVQFKSSTQAQAATELDNISQKGDLKLDVKLSDPGHRKVRSGPMYEGREVHVMNVDWSVTEEELSEVFSKYGNVEKVRIPRNMAGKSKGFAFVVFSNQDDAVAALDLNLTKFKTRLLHVSMSTSDPAKRQAINNVRQTSTSTSPAPDPATSPLPSNNTSETSLPLPTSDTTNPSAQAAIETSTAASHPSRSDIVARTLALLYIPDTVNEARVRALLEPYGPLKKLTMRLDHQGAIVEFADVSAVGRAALGLEGVEIAEGRRITVGSVAELMKEKGEVRRDRLPVGQPKKDGETKVIQSSGVIRRPVQTTGRRDGRGGLGLKKSGGGLGGPRAAGDGGTTAPATNGDAGPATDGDTVMGATAETGKVKSNADFKAMFLKS